MASGHVNRTNRPNTWLHRPATRREDFPCQLGAVHTWHFATLSDAVNLRAASGQKLGRRTYRRGATHGLQEAAPDRRAH